MRVLVEDLRIDELFLLPTDPDLLVAREFNDVLRQVKAHGVKSKVTCYLAYGQYVEANWRTETRKSSMQLSEQKDDNTLPITAVLIGQTFIPEGMGTQAVFMRVSAQVDLSPHIWVVNLSTGVSLAMSNNARCVLVDVQGTWVVRK